MDDMFDDPGDLGFFFDEEPTALDTDVMDNDEFYEPYPGEEEQS